MQIVFNNFILYFFTETVEYVTSTEYSIAPIYKARYGSSR